MLVGSEEDRLEAMFCKATYEVEVGEEFFSNLLQGRGREVELVSAIILFPFLFTLLTCSPFFSLSSRASCFPPSSLEPNQPNPPPSLHLSPTLNSTCVPS